MPPAGRRRGAPPAATRDASLTTRDAAAPPPRPGPRTNGASPEQPRGKRYAVVIGIDRYREWERLSNAVNDARGTLKAFEALGFAPFRPPLVDEHATGSALMSLVTDELSALSEHDSLVLFFAGHGHTHAHGVGGAVVKQGYLIPVDGKRAPGPTGSWLNLDTWLTHVDHLPARHILIILDACHSGIALNEVIRWRGHDMRIDDPIEQLGRRRSRRVITSALDNQRALDSGPIRNHSLFTGCLIEALTGGLVAKTRKRIATGSDIWLHIRDRICTYPGVDQTPDYGALGLDDRGELVIRFGPPPAEPVNPWSHPAPELPHKQRPPKGPRPRTQTPVAARPVLPHGFQARRRAGGGPALVPVPGLDPALVAALDRHEAERARGVAAVSVVVGPAGDAARAYAMWAARREYTTLVTGAESLEAAAAELLAGFPWLRCAAAARATLAAAAGVGADAIGAALDARSGREYGTWIEEIARSDRLVRVSGWLISALRDRSLRAPNPATAPLQGAALLSALGELAAPLAVLVQQDAPGATAAGAARALATAGALTAHLPGHAIALAAAKEPGATAAAAAKPRVVQLGAAPALAPSPRTEAAHALLEHLARDARTAGLFQQGVRVHSVAGNAPFEVDLVARHARLAVCIDDWHRVTDAQAYRRARTEDALLQGANFYAMRFLPEEIEAHPELVVDEIAICLGTCRAN